MRPAVPIVLAVLLVAGLVVGLNQASDDGGAVSADEPFELEAALASLDGAPAPLAALHDQAAKLLDGGAPAFKARLKELSGHPVVINKWASWCGPCRSEFPVFQRVSARRGGAVGFLGIDGFDNRGDAEAFLREFPTPYPSYVDPDEKIATAMDVPANYPITLFVDERGNPVLVHQGEYRTDAELEADIDRYLGA